MIVVVWFDGGGGRRKTPPGTWGPWDAEAEWVGAAQPWEVGEGQQEANIAARAVPLAGLLWKGILPRRGTRADEMRGTFWDLTNTFHYESGPQTTEGFVMNVFFISQGKLLPLR